MTEILKLFSRRKKALALIIGLGLVFSLIPLQFAQAGECSSWDVFCIIGVLIDIVITGFIGLPAAIIVFGLFLVAFFQGLVFFLLGGIIATFITQTLSIKVIPGPETVSIVNTGWEFTRDFANMFLILILAIIGLATILKLKEYEAKKMLPMLILVALLINFSGVLVGFVVDMGNLMTNFFIEKFAGFSVAGLIDKIWNIPFNFLKNAILGIFTGYTDPFTKLGVIIGSIVYGLAILFFYVFGFWILVIVMLIFFLRVIVLWVLSILAPIAFLSRALPPTPTVKRLFPSILHWDEWWEKLIQWSIIGIPIGFFLVLSQTLFEEGVGLGGLEAPRIDDPALLEGMEGSAELVNIFANMGGFISNIFAPLVGLILMGLGVFISMKAAPAIAQGIIKASSERGRAIAQAWVTKGAGTARREAGRIRHTYQAGRALGLSRRRAAGESVRRYWQRRIQPRVPSPAPITIRGRQIVPPGRRARAIRAMGIPVGGAAAATRGILTSTRNIAEAGIRAGLGVKKRGMRPGGCPECRGRVAASAAACPHCGHVF